MADGPTFDDFLADPVAVWLVDPGLISDAWAVQAARASRAFRVHLKDELARCIGETGGFDGADRQTRVLAEICDAEDIAALFGDLVKVRPPADWAADFAKRFGR